MRIVGKDAVYELAARFSASCLANNYSLLWPDRPCWTAENLDRLWVATIGDPKERGRTFYDKWEAQLSNQPDDVHRVAADVFTMFSLFSDKMNLQSKIDKIQRIVQWKLEGDQPNWEIVTPGLRPGIGNPGSFYMIGMQWHVGFLVAFSRRFKASSIDLSDDVAIRKLADEALKDLPYDGTAMRNVLLHLMYPDRYERIAVTGDKHKIARTFNQWTHETDDVDEALYQAREGLSESLDRPNLDFYQKDLWDQWDPTRTAGDSGDKKQESENISDRSWWMEKTIVQGRADRLGTDNALGKALWSPKRDTRGADIYRFMREVKRGDIILHCTDNRGITGISIASDEVKDFDGVPDTEWGVVPSYRIQLERFQELDPILSREIMFSPPFGEQLLGLIDAGIGQVFYNRAGQFRQGAYLTPIKPELLDVLDAAYLSVADRSLTTIGNALFGGILPELEPEGDDESNTLEELAEEVLMDVDELRKIDLLLRDKKQIVFYGPPGTGKTYLAQKMARVVTGSGNRVEIVQLHPSYAYEDFVEGYRPVLSESGQPSFELRPGPLKRLAEKAESDPDHDYLLVIDEMNRGNVAKVFGELYFLLEYRQQKIRLQYSGDDDQFSLPNNLFFICTMNTADRSIALVDSALRRRFYFAPFFPDAPPIKGLLSRWLSINVPEMLWVADIVDKANELLGDHHSQIGPSHFMKTNLNNDWLDLIWSHSVMPYLEEQMFSNPSALDAFRLQTLMNPTSNEPENLEGDVSDV